jgi:Histidine kinase/Histidine kinase-, DNA gyrase B-, and HSP90-like ATPase
MWPIVREALAGASPPVRRQVRWVVGLWCALVVLQIWDSRNAAGPAGVAEFLSALLGVSGVALLGAAHTLHQTMAEAADRRRPAGETEVVQQVLLALPALAFSAGVALGAAAALMLLRGLLGAELALVSTGLIVYVAMLVFAGHTVNRSVRTLFRHAAEQAAAAADARSKAADAQLAALQARMNPHFLFNALNTVASLVRSNPRAAEHVVENLSDVLRMTLARSAETMGTVDDELRYVQAYLALEQERLGDRLRVAWDVGDDARAWPLPPLTLQPVVENALRHGLGSQLEGGVLRISVRAGAALVMGVHDDDPGFPPGWTEGTGLGNLRQRLQTLYGGRASLIIDSPGRGARVTLTIPSGA